MSTTQWIIVGWLALSGLVMFVRGIAGTTRTYTGWDAASAVVEVGVLIWLVASL